MTPFAAAVRGPCLAGTVAASLFVGAPASGQVPARVRGTIAAIGHGSITVKESDGTALALRLGSDTTYAYVVRSSLHAIKVTDFVGSAVKGPLNSLVAVEVAIIPPDMQAGRIGLYDWDPLPDPTATHTPVLTTTRMTKGIVSAEGNGAEGLMLTVRQDGSSHTFRITVPRNAPVVRYVRCSRSALAINSAVMVKTNPGGRAGLVTVGKGVTPPM